jgi:hypothetical protein
MNHEPLNNGAIVELVFSLIDVVIWLLVSWRFWPQIRKLRGVRRIYTWLVLLIIWSTLITFVFRSLHDLSFFPIEFALVPGSIVRALYLLVGIVLAVLGPQDEEI